MARFLLFFLLVFHGVEVGGRIILTSDAPLQISTLAKLPLKPCREMDLMAEVNPFQSAEPFRD